MRPVTLALLVGCSAPRAGVDSSDPDTSGETDGVACPGYPADPVEPMTLGEVLAPYSWPDAIDRRTGARMALDLADVPCAADEVIDWSPFDVLLFISIPAW